MPRVRQGTDEVFEMSGELMTGALPRSQSEPSSTCKERQDRMEFFAASNSGVSLAMIGIFGREYFLPNIR